MPANKQAMRHINQEIDSQKPQIYALNATSPSKEESSQACTSTNMTRNKITDHMEVDNKNKCGQCEYENTDEYTLKQHKRDVHRDLSASVTTPPEKRMETNREVENEVDIVMQKNKDLKVCEENKEIEIKEEDKIPDRLSEMLEFKGLDIKKKQGEESRCRGEMWRQLCVPPHYRY